MEKFIIGFNSNFDVVENFKVKSVFYISKDLEKDTFRFKFNGKINNSYILYAYEFMLAYLSMSNIPINTSNDLALDILFNEDYKINEAMSLSFLINKLEVYLHMFCKDASIDELGDEMFGLALNKLMDVYDENELKDYWENVDL